MTLEDVVKTLEETARLQPGVNSIVRNDVFRLNELADAQYAVFSWIQGRHTSSSTSRTFGFSLMYIDRLTADGKNQVEIQSVGMGVLDNIVRTMTKKGINADTFTLTPFRQRFVDECAGVLCNVNFSVEKENCVL